MPGINKTTTKVLAVCALLLPEAAWAQQPPAPSPSAAAAPTAPNTTVATVKLTGGERASKLIGSDVYNDQDQKIGSIDDLIVADDDRITTVIIQVGGFLGIGGKLVAVPYDKLQPGQNNHLTIPGATKDALNAMPGFTYSG
jgi:sporulation protein YlmC with PRC-barrel domain